MKNSNYYVECDFESIFAMYFEKTSVGTESVHERFIELSRKSSVEILKRNMPMSSCTKYYSN